MMFDVILGPPQRIFLAYHCVKGKTMTTSKNINENGLIIDKMRAAQDARGFLMAAVSHCQWMSQNSMGDSAERPNWKAAAERLGIFAREIGERMPPNRPRPS
jgi:hypothetical protein